MSKEYDVKINVDECRKLLKYVSKEYKIPKVIYDVIKDVARKEIEEQHKTVLIKRDPNIESRRIQGAFVKIIEGPTIQIPPPIVGGFMADFDGFLKSFNTKYLRILDGHH